MYARSPRQAPRLWGPKRYGGYHMELLAKYSNVKLVISPIGAQGFILGRGNLQLSPMVIKKIGIEKIMVTSTPAKLANTPHLMVDTGDEKLDDEIRSKVYLPVIIMFRMSRMVPLGKVKN